ncbi:hypothetical protein HT102_09915 [Hoyosella sp. G463]|uniref:Uncharacterized protein n=1 Tax=Lolliginicoccus lacisalsi TaxID=2742202 RepID=A0A927JCW7_9ACTN|nr:hypothetical protein [Lolliginicoccus lacisalsi]MBD8506803.1 hypothetical protein [Lolliginicoccus lacisalsi]
MTGTIVAHDTVRARYVLGSIVVAILLVIAGLVLNWLIAPDEDFVFVEGVSALAVLYVIAQGVERINEMLVSVLDFVFGRLGATFPESRKIAAERVLREQRAAARAGSAGGGVDAGAVMAAESAVRAARRELRILTAVVGFGLSFLFLAALDTGLFEVTIRSPHVPIGIDWVLSAAVLVGGATALHDFISTLRGSKERAETLAS